MSIAFVICVEAGPLEAQSVLFAESVRRWGGRYADARIVSLEPRGPSGMSETTHTALAELGVEHRNEVLNHKFPKYPIANKIFSAAWAERNLTEDVIAVCDTDTFFLNEPERLEVDAGLAARPVWQKKRGSVGPHDPNDAYWERMYELCGVDVRPWVTTPAGTEIRAYFNSGLVAVRRDEGILAAWLNDFLTLMEAKCFPSDGRRNMDQLALAATTARVWDRVRVLEPSYNYMLRRRPRMPEPDRSLALEELVHVHYRKWLAVPGFVRDLEPSFPEGERLRWLTGHLPLQSAPSPPAASPQVRRVRPNGVTRDGRLIVHDLTAEADVLRAQLAVNGRDRELVYKLGGIEPTHCVDAIAVALLPLAMSKGWTLELPGELSPELGGLDPAQDLLADWWQHWTQVELRTGSAPSESAPERGRGVACFFTGGVDGFYSVLTELDRLDAVIFAHGFDVPLSDPLKREQVSKSLREAADGLGLELIEVESNIRDFTWRGCKWGQHAHGAALASIALLTGDRFSEVLVPASHKPHDVFPWGTHQDLDPLWSTEAVRIVHHGQVGRTRKVAELARSDVALAHLRCCSEETQPGELNCGRCGKCLRTMASLRIVGALERCDTMPDVVPLREVKRMVLPRRGWVTLTRDLHAEAKAAGDDELAKALRQAVLFGHLRARAANARKAVGSRGTKLRRRTRRRVRRGLRRARGFARRDRDSASGRGSRVRPAVLPDDREAILAVLEPEGLHRIPSAEMEDLSVGNWFVAESAGTITGVAGFRLDRTRDGIVGKNLLLAVQKEHRGQGVGRALVNRRLQLMREAGATKVVTNTDRPELISWLIRDYGFRAVGEVEKLHPFGRPEVDRWTTLEASMAEAAAGMSRSSRAEAR